MFMRYKQDCIQGKSLKIECMETILCNVSERKQIHSFLRTVMYELPPKINGSKKKLKQIIPSETSFQNINTVIK